MTPKERPILFSGDMVEAILAGRKTQTRRPIKNPDFMGCTTGDCPHEKQTECNVVLASQCPYQVGMRLWVRETWLELDHDHRIDLTQPKQFKLPNGKVNGIAYRADCDSESDGIRKEYGYQWRPSIHMPRWASRLTLLVTDVRVQRVQEISEEDAIAEGVKGRLKQFARHPGQEPAGQWTAVEEFESLWEQTYGPGAWERNDWVWAIGFEVAK